MKRKCIAGLAIFLISLPSFPRTCTLAPEAKVYRDLYAEEESRIIRSKNHYLSQMEDFFCRCRFATPVKFSPSLRVFVVNGYETTQNSQGTVNAQVTESGPIALILSSYESVHWVIDPGPAKLEAVILLGHEAQTYEGPPVPLIVSTLMSVDHCQWNQHYIYDNFSLDKYMSVEKRPYTIQKLWQLSLMLLGKEPETYHYEYRLPAELNLPSSVALHNAGDIRP